MPLRKAGVFVASPRGLCGLPARCLAAAMQAAVAAVEHTIVFHERQLGLTLKPKVIKKMANPAYPSVKTLVNCWVVSGFVRTFDGSMSAAEGYGTGCGLACTGASGSPVVAAAGVAKCCPETLCRQSTTTLFSFGLSATRMF